MAYIYLDESGDLGFDFTKKQTSKYFVITFLCADNRRPLDKIIKKTFAEFSKRQIRSHGGILHAYKETPSTRCKVLSSLAEKEIGIITIYLNKEKIYTRLQDEKIVLYNYVVNILLDRLMSRQIFSADQQITFVASKRETSKFLNENFKNYLADQVHKKHRLKLRVEIKTPHEDKGLQLVDMVSWAVYRKWEHGDSSYYDLIKDKIIEEDSLFPEGSNKR